MMCQLLQSILQDYYYDELRTKRQLGYIVSSQADRFGQVGRLGLVIQSSLSNPDALLQAVDDFIRGFRLVIASMSRRQLNSYKLAVIQKVVKVDESLDEEFSRWWQAIALFEYEWRRREVEANLVANVTQLGLLDFFDRFVAEGSPDRRRLVTAVFARSAGSATAAAGMRARCAAAGARIVDDPTKFCAELPKVPLRDRGPGDSL